MKKNVMKFILAAILLSACGHGSTRPEANGRDSILPDSLRPDTVDIDTIIGEDGKRTFIWRSWTLWSPVKKKWITDTEQEELESIDTLCDESYKEGKPEVRMIGKGSRFYFPIKLQKCVIK